MDMDLGMGLDLGINSWAVFPDLHTPVEVFQCTGEVTLTVTSLLPSPSKIFELPSPHLPSYQADPCLLRPNFQTTDSSAAPTSSLWGRKTFQSQVVLDSQMWANYLQFLIKWKGYGYEENSWENKSNIQAPELIADFCHLHPGAPHHIHSLKAVMFCNLIPVSPEGPPCFRSLHPKRGVMSGEYHYFHLLWSHSSPTPSSIMSSHSHYSSLSICWPPSQPSFIP